MFDIATASPEAERADGLAWSTLAPDGTLATLLADSDGIASSPETAEFERVERIGAWEKIIAWAQAQQIAEIAAFVAEAESEPDPVHAPPELALSAEAEIRLMLRLTHGTAAFRVGRARLLCQRFPATLAALREGATTLPKAYLIVEECEVLDTDHAAAAEAAVLPRAPQLTLGQLRALLRREILAADPAAAAARHRRARRERSVVLYPERDGMANLSATLPAAEALGVFAVLDEHARRLGADDERPMDERRADVLTDLILGPTGHCAAGTAAALGTPVVADPGVDSDRLPGDLSSLPGPTAIPAIPPDDTPGWPGCAVPHRPARISVQVRVTVSLDTLRGIDDEPGELAGYGPIGADQARELAAGGDTWQRLVTDPLSGALLDHGATRYRPPPQLAEFVRTRDRTCGHPGCRVPAHRCDLDHTVPFGAGGPTSAGNLKAACRTHHRIKQMPGWRVAQAEDGTVTWTTPSGHAYTSTPPPLHHPRTTPPLPGPLPDEPPF